MAETIRANDVITGSMGKCTAIIKGNIEDMLYVKNIEAKIAKEKSEISVLGQTGKKHKSNGWKGTGKMNIYYATSLYRRIMLEYIKTGVDTYFDLIIENADPTSSIGKQTIMLKGVNIDSVLIAKIDVSSTELDEDVEFTFQDVEMLNEFGQLVGE